MLGDNDSGKVSGRHVEESAKLKHGFERAVAPIEYVQVGQWIETRVRRRAATFYGDRSPLTIGKLFEGPKTLTHWYLRMVCLRSVPHSVRSLKLSVFLKMEQVSELSCVP
jgi:hypothetical protein